MAGSMKASSAAQRRQGRRGSHRPMADINVTPLVDVMLVLLIVFMVAAPLLTVGVPVDLPKAQSQPINDPKEALYITVKSDGTILIQETPVQLDALAPRLKAILSSKPDAPIYVRGDQGIRYGAVMEVMGKIAEAGFEKVGLITELPPGAPARPGQRQGTK
jgi:biopolymer transport protein TolR